MNKSKLTYKFWGGGVIIKFPHVYGRCEKYRTGNYLEALLIKYLFDYMDGEYIDGDELVFFP